MAYEMIDAFSPLGSGKVEEDRYTVTAEVGQFRDTSVYTPGEKSSSVSNFDMGSNRVSVYPNGRENSTQGHVSLEFDISFRRVWGHEADLPSRHVIADTILYLYLSCVVSVVDAGGCARHPRSYEFKKETADTKVNFFVESYVSRDFLLSSADELLPDDKLTIQVDFVQRMVYTDFSTVRLPFEILWASFTTEKGRDGEPDQTYFLLDSIVAQRLRKESKFVDLMCASPMAEMCSGKVKVPDPKELDDLFWVLGILWVPDIGMNFTVQQILDFYKVADFYVIERMLDICRRWLKLVCRTRGPTREDISLISSTAEKFGDPFLKNIEYRRIWADIAEVRDDDWTCVPVEDHNDVLQEAPQKFFFRGTRTEETEGETGEGTDDTSLPISYQILCDSFKTEKGSEGEPDQTYFLLDSVAARRLRRESKYFEALCAAPMAEKYSGKMKFPEPEQFCNLKWIMSILWVPDIEKKFTMPEILCFYGIAHLYVLESMLGVCRRWLKLVCRTRRPAREDISLIYKTADKYGDPFLKNIADEYRRIWADIPEVRDDDWTCVPVDDHNDVLLEAPQKFLFLRRRRIEEIDGEKGEGTTELLADFSNCYI